MLINVRCDYDFKNKKVLERLLNSLIILHYRHLTNITVRRSSNKHFHVIYELSLPDEFKRIDEFSLSVGLRLGFADDFGRCIHDIARKEVELSTDKLFAGKILFKKYKQPIIKKCGDWLTVYKKNEDKEFKFRGMELPNKL